MKRLLVIDDVAVIRGFVKAALKELKVNVVEASGGKQGLEMHDTLPADIILCDINMPGINGEAFLRTLREKGDQTPVIMLTAEGDKAVVGNLLKLGIQGYVLKPFKPAILAERVQELLTGSAPTPPAAQPATDATAAPADETSATAADPAAADTTPASDTETPAPTA